MESGNTGITYFRIPESKIEDYKKYGDKVINCGLNGNQIDNNFFTLRENDIYGGEVKNGELILLRGNGESIRIRLRDDIEIVLSGSTYDREKGILELNINGETHTIDGFCTCSPEEIDARLSSLETDVVNIAIDEDNNRKAIVKANGDITTLSARTSDGIAVIEKEIDNLEQRATAIECDIKNNVKKDISNIKNTLSSSAITINENFSSDRSRISSLESSVTKINNDVSGLENDLGCTSDRVDRLDEIVASISTETTGNKNNIDVLSAYTHSKIINVEDRIDELNSITTKHDSDISKIGPKYDSQISNIKDEISCIKNDAIWESDLPNLVKWVPKCTQDIIIGTIKSGDINYDVKIPKYLTPTDAEKKYATKAELEKKQGILTAGNGITISSTNIISLDSTVELSGVTEEKAKQMIDSAIETETERTEGTYQKILTAGDGIVIEDNVISFAGGGEISGITEAKARQMIDDAIEAETARTESAYLKEHQSLEGYATEEWVGEQEYQNENDVKNLIEEKTSNFQTDEDVKKAVGNAIASEIERADSAYSKKSDIDDAIASEIERADSAYSKKSDIDDAIASETARTEDTYQKILTAGEGVTIEDNVISISGGGGDVTKEDLSNLKEEIENEIDDVKDDMSVLEASIDKEVENREGLQTDLDGKIGNWNEEFSGSTITEEVKKLGKGGVVNIATDTPKWIEIKDDEEKTGKIINFLGIENEEFRPPFF